LLHLSPSSHGIILTPRLLPRLNRAYLVLYSKHGDPPRLLVTIKR
jgi:hypothetical protein